MKVIQEKDKLVIATASVIVEVQDDFKVDFYNQNHELLCADYRGERKRQAFLDQEALQIAALEGHVINQTSGEKMIEVRKAMQGDEAFYGLGDKTGFLNKRGYEYEMWNSDIPDPQVDSFKSLYKSIPFFITLRKEAVFGIFFDNTYRTYFDMGKESEAYYSFGADEGIWTITLLPVVRWRR
jgi:alpha-glucosidase